MDWLAEVSAPTAGKSRGQPAPSVGGVSEAGCLPRGDVSLGPLSVSSPASLSPCLVPQPLIPSLLPAPLCSDSWGPFRSRAFGCAIKCAELAQEALSPHFPSCPGCGHRGCGLHKPCLRVHRRAALARASHKPCPEPEDGSELDKLRAGAQGQSSVGLAATPSGRQSGEPVSPEVLSLLIWRAAAGRCVSTSGSLWGPFWVRVRAASRGQEPANCAGSVGNRSHKQTPVRCRPRPCRPERPVGSK